MPSTRAMTRTIVLSLPASFVVTADHDPGKDDGGLLGWRFCRSGLELVGDYPELTRRTPMPTTQRT
jgi:hypothetical protein